MNDRHDNPPAPLPVRKYRYVLATMVLLSVLYSLVVYTSDSKNPLPPMSEAAMKGGMLWQQNNCTACHQLYGLGGYLGPDLTNVLSRPGKGAVYVKAFLNAGINAMPVFHFSEDEKESLVAFLNYVDQTGHFPNSKARLRETGWVELDYKTNNTGNDE